MIPGVVFSKLCNMYVLSAMDVHIIPPPNSLSIFFISRKKFL